MDMAVEKSSSKVSHKLLEALEERIITGAYSPGMRLDETELAAEFSVSRTPVREALIHLSTLGLVELRPRRGAVVAEASPKRLYEMFEVMAELEAMSVRLAARRHTQNDLHQIEAALAACERALEHGDIDAYYAENERFHRAIYSASHNRFLFESAISISRRLGAYRRLQLRLRGRVRRSYDEHAGILRALACGDGDAAADIIHRHVVIQGEHFADLLATLVDA
ncbi:GntR family transcriptional regulator [Propionivibrio dicarboxylicus]|uniref:DNA-binding transcriptional regulator, GntR family n=1 Tax=Propionivibrio dicarboxylicus TaxID=83767 RepID=A0A1G8I3P9_9RHOO|nr:GntR family transcriptional regulator [Propionivibrio dicarboxylicus]SDI13270.1 DNA-binding transcriptional regulator, GntR family [Propionivibrio dicarboxylicus]